MSAVATPAKLINAEEFFDFVHRPENHGRFFELEQGEIIEMPPPKRPHGRVCTNAGWVMENYSRQKRRGNVCSNDAGFILERDPDTVRGIDVSFYDDRLTFDELPKQYDDHAPKVAIEVLSPTDTWAKMLRRVAQLLQAGVDLVWVIDPEERSVSVHRRGRDPYVLQEHEELSGEDVLPDFRCKVADFFVMPGA